MRCVACNHKDTKVIDSRLSQGGMSGFFYDASADGHYVTVQRLDWGSALVIWNTFDKNGQAAWIYSIGEVSGNHIHAQGAQNLGGVLPGRCTDRIARFCLG